jgi:hypothetical protein
MELVEEPPWARPSADELTLLYSHQDQVTALPPDGRVLARAAHCPVAMLAVGDDMIGMQAHPEFGAAYLRALLQDRVDRIGADETEHALATLERRTDEGLGAAWILAFLRSRARLDRSRHRPVG